MKVSVLIPVYGRMKQLSRSLWLLEHQNYPDYEIILVDDGTVNFDFDLTNLPHVRYYRLRPPGSDPRSPNKAWRHAYNHAEGDYIITSHPEILVPLSGIARLLACGMSRAVPIMYVLQEEQQRVIDTVDWKSDLSNLKNLPDFRAARSPWGYTNLDLHTHRNHLSFSGAGRAYWDRFGFLPDVEDPLFLSDDAWLHKQEMEEGVTPFPVDLEVYHQWHERVYGEVPQYSINQRRIRSRYLNGEGE